MGAVTGAFWKAALATGAMPFGRPTSPGRVISKGSIAGRIENPHQPLMTDATQTQICRYVLCTHTQVLPSSVTSHGTDDLLPFLVLLAVLLVVGADAILLVDVEVVP